MDRSTGRGLEPGTHTVYITINLAVRAHLVIQRAAVRCRPKTDGPKNIAILNPNFLLIDDSICLGELI